MSEQLCKELTLQMVECGHWEQHENFSADYIMERGLNLKTWDTAARHARFGEKTIIAQCRVYRALT